MKNVVLTGPEMAAIGRENAMRLLGRSK